MVRSLLFSLAGRRRRPGGAPAGSLLELAQQADDRTSRCTRPTARAELPPPWAGGAMRIDAAQSPSQRPTAPTTPSNVDPAVRLVFEIARTVRRRARCPAHDDGITYAMLCPTIPRSGPMPRGRDDAARSRLGPGRTRVVAASSGRLEGIHDVTRATLSRGLSQTPPQRSAIRTPIRALVRTARGLCSRTGSPAEIEEQLRAARGRRRFGLRASSLRDDIDRVARWRASTLA